MEKKRSRSSLPGSGLVVAVGVLAGWLCGGLCGLAVCGGLAAWGGPGGGVSCAATGAANADTSAASIRTRGEDKLTGPLFTFFLPFRSVRFGHNQGRNRA